MIQRSAPAFPEALDDDDDDVTWALQTAAVQWKRGAHADAIEWLHRAIESAVDGGRAIRAREIQQQVNLLEAALKTGWRPDASSAAPPQRPAQRNPFLSESADLVHDPYGELAVDLDMESSFKLRSRLPSSALPRKAPVPFSSPAEDVSDEELIEEIEAFEDDELEDDAAALAAPRMPFVTAPTLESDALEEDEFIEPDAEPDGELPTLPPALHGLAPPGRRMPSVPPRPPNLPATPSWPPPASQRPLTYPPSSSRPPSVRPPASEPPASVRPESELAPSTPEGALPSHAATWQQSSTSSAPASSRPRNRPSFPKISSAPAGSPAGAGVRSPAPPSPPPPPVRNKPLPPRPANLSSRTGERSSNATPSRTESSASPRARGNRRPSERALALEQKIAAAKALARQRRRDAGLSDEEPAEPAEIEPMPSSSVPLRDVSSHPPDTIVSSPPESFRSLPPDETTERDIEAQRRSEPLPNIQRDSAPVLSYGSFDDYDPSTSPSLTTPFEGRQSSPPPSRRRSAAPIESTPPETEPPLPPSLDVCDAITTKHDLTAEIAAISRSEAEAPASQAPASQAPASQAPASQAPLSEAPESTIPASLPLSSEPQLSAVPISIPLVSAVPSPEPAVSAIPISIPLISAAPGADAPPQATPEVAAPSGPRPTDIAGIELGNVPGLEDLPEESQRDLVAAAEIHELAPDEEVSGFELALVLEGGVSVMPAIADVAAARAARGELIFSQGHLDPGLPIRVVASQDGAKVASFSKRAFEAAVRDCPWVGDELKGVGDRLQTLAGVALGPMGEELDDMLRGLVVQHCEVRRFLPNEVVASAGKPVPGMVIVGAGHIEVVEEERGSVTDEVGPGAFLFAAEILQASPAPNTARAGEEGALVLFAERRVAHELMVSVPPLLGIFAR